MEPKKILIVDDSPDMLEVIYRQLRALDYRPLQALAVADALDVLKRSSVDLLITDLQMPGIDGMKLVKYVAEHFPEMPVLVITGYPSVPGAVEAIQSGALEYIVKPFTSGELKAAVEKALSRERVLHGSASNFIGSLSYRGIIGESEALKEVFQLIERVKDNKVTVLISGESGTGKELVARAIHYSGNFSKSPFVAVNCAAIPENLLESELFGFVKGAFTGAHETRQGFFQAANGGTIFLDEIGSASLAVQTRLLRVIQEREVIMIGANRAQKIDVRIMTATNTDLLSMTKTGAFREDLFYRLNVVSIVLPPLRDRKEDIPLLAAYFLSKFSREYKKSNVRITEKAMEILARHSWPGNIRELENVVHRSLIMCDDAIDVVHLPEYLKLPLPDAGSQADLMTLKDAEKMYILKVLRSVENNKTKAAKILGIDRKTLRQKIQ